MAQRAQNVQFQRVGGGGGGGIVVRPARREGGRRQAEEECRYCHESGHVIRECPRLASKKERQQQREQQRAEEECRYCREKGHRIRRWNHSTSKNEVECPKLLAKEQGKSQGNVYSAFSSSQRRQRMGGGGGATTSNLGGWVNKAFKNTRQERRVGRRALILRKAATKISNPFAALDEEVRSPKKAAIPTPRFVTPAAASGVWGAAATLRKGIDALLEEEAVAEAIGAVAAAERKEREAAAAKAAENVGSLVPISKKLPTPAAVKAAAAETSPKSVTFSDEDETRIMEERGKATASAMRKARRGTWRLDAMREQREQREQEAAAAAAAPDDWEADWEGSQTTPSVLTSVPGGIDMTIINDGWGDDAGDENGDGW